MAAVFTGIPESCIPGLNLNVLVQICCNASPKTVKCDKHVKG